MKIRKAKYHIVNERRQLLVFSFLQIFDALVLILSFGYFISSSATEYLFSIDDDEQ